MRDDKNAALREEPRGHRADDDEGAVAMEYTIVAALVSLGLAAGATALGLELNDFFERAASALSEWFTAALNLLN